MIAIDPAELQRLRSQRDLGWLLAIVMTFGLVFTVAALAVSEMRARMVEGEEGAEDVRADEGSFTGVNPQAEAEVVATRFPVLGLEKDQRSAQRFKWSALLDRPRK
ncbi:MAG: hypothetical protein E6Q97_09455 [Desulfurellales bacterium]|nr:MAG: hypothetical protein E6Q97_09455 [Desulfurellales bacterium]